MTKGLKQMTVEAMQADQNKAVKKISAKPKAAPKKESAQARSGRCRGHEDRHDDFRARSVLSAEPFTGRARTSKRPRPRRATRTSIRGAQAEGVHADFRSPEGFRFQDHRSRRRNASTLVADGLDRASEISDQPIPLDRGIPKRGWLFRFERRTIRTPRMNAEPL